MSRPVEPSVPGYPVLENVRQVAPLAREDGCGNWVHHLSSHLEQWLNSPTSQMIYFSLSFRTSQRGMPV
jgi:hypothetical protein